jgi:hypothetical protein
VAEKQFVKYKISISRIDQVDILKREYQRVADTGNERDNGPVYDYAICPTTTLVETEILKQEITEDIALKEIIRAINNL